jgi:hypothetical protein
VTNPVAHAPVPREAARPPTTKGAILMSMAITQSQRVGSAHVRELNQILARGQTNSRTALVDTSLGTAWAIGKGSSHGAAPDHQLIAAFGSMVFAPHRLSSAKRDRVHEMITELGGIGMVAVLMRDCDLFIAILPSSARVISLVIRHNHAGTVGSDTVVRGRSIRTKLDPRANVAQAIEQQTAHSYSIWDTLFKSVLLRFRRSGSGGAAATGALSKMVSVDEHVIAADLFDLNRKAHVEQYRAPQVRMRALDPAAAIAAFRELFIAGAPDIRALLKPLGFGDAEYGKVQVQVGKVDFYWLRVPYFPVLHLPFDPDRVLLLYKEPRPNPALDWVSLDHAGLNLLRLRISSLLDGGLNTTLDPFPETQIEFQAILDELGQLPPDDLLNRLDIGGFLPRPREVHGVVQRCQECIYYLPHRQWCDLPELPVPVKPEWWCRLWKV